MGLGGVHRGCRGGQRDMKMDGVCWEQVGGGGGLRGRESGDRVGGGEVTEELGCGPQLR